MQETTLFNNGYSSPTINVIEFLSANAFLQNSGGTNEDYEEGGEG